MHLDELGNIVVHDLRHHGPISEVSLDVLLWPREGQLVQLS